MNEGRLRRNYVLAALRSSGAQIHLDVRYKPFTTAPFSAHYRLCYALLFIHYDWLSHMIRHCPKAEKDQSPSE